MNQESGYKKAIFEQAVRFMIINLFVPLPEFNNFGEYN